MLLSEVLNLDKVQSSIRKIDTFLTTQSKVSKEYLIALSYKALVLNKIGKANEALRLLFPLVPNFKIYDIDAVIAICDSIIDICLSAKRYDQVLKYIELKNRYLPVSKSYIHIKDEIKYYLATNDNENAKIYLLKLVDDYSSKEDKIYALKELSKIYFNEQQYDLYLEYTKDLEEYYINNVVLDELNELTLNKLKIAYIKGNYTKVICDGTGFIKLNIPNDYIIETATLLMKSYLECNDYKRASITESSYEEYLSEEYAKASLEFSKTAYTLYSKTHTIVSMNEYQNKIKLYEGITKEVKKERKSRKKVQEIEIPSIEIEEDTEDEIEEKLFYKPINEEEDEPIRIETKIAKINDIVVSERFNNLSNIFKVISEVDADVKFRELFRLSCIEIAKSFSIEEVYLLYFKGSYSGIHYKVERAYDKKLTIDKMEGTIPYLTMINEEEYFYDNEGEYNKSIITGKEFTGDTYLFSIPLASSIDTIGSLTFKSSVRFLDEEMVYESLKLITSILNTRLIAALKNNEIMHEEEKLFFISSNMSSGIKEESDGYIHFSTKAVEILGVIPDISLNDYYLKIAPKDLPEYKRIVEELYQLLTMDIEYEYDFINNNKTKRIKERFYPILKDGVIHIYSLIDDITDIKEKEDSLLELAYCNPISKLETELKLAVDLEKNYKEHKLSLVILEVNELDLYKDLYGYNFKKQLILAVANELKKEFINEFDYSVYHLDALNYGILMNGMNDKRAVDARLTKAFNNIRDALYKINSRVKLTFNAGVYRLGKNTSLANPTDMITYAFDSLQIANEENSIGNMIVHYEGEEHKKRHYHNSLITHISEAIDHGKIGLTYQQVADIKENSVFGYYLKLNLDNIEVDEEIMSLVITKKGLSKQLEQYAIINALREERIFHDKLKSFLLCFIRVSLNNIDEAFFNYIEKERNQLKISSKAIVFDLDRIDNRILTKLREIGYLLASHDLLDVYSNKCDFFFYDYHKSDCDIAEIKALCYSHDVKLILTNVNEKNDIDYAKATDTNIVYGKFYKKALRLKTIIEKLSK